MSKVRIAVAALALSFAVSGMPYALAFTDPLDQPARLSERAVSAPLYSLAAFGTQRVVAVGSSTFCFSHLSTCAPVR